MKEKLGCFFSKVLNIVTVVSIIIYVYINVENMFCLGDEYDDSKSFLQSLDYTYSGINNIFFVMISILMISCILLNEKINKKSSRKFEFFLVICIVIMRILVAISSRSYADYIFH